MAQLWWKLALRSQVETLIVVVMLFSVRKRYGSVALVAVDDGRCTVLWGCWIEPRRGRGGGENVKKGEGAREKEGKVRVGRGGKHH